MSTSTTLALPLNDNGSDPVLYSNTTLMVSDEDTKASCPLTFHPFSHLPIEIQTMVWKEAFRIYLATGHDPYQRLSRSGIDHMAEVWSSVPSLLFTSYVARKLTLEAMTKLSVGNEVLYLCNESKRMGTWKPFLTTIRWGFKGDKGEEWSMGRLWLAGGWYDARLLTYWYKNQLCT